MTTTITDYNADARDRLWALLEFLNVGFRDRLKQSADAAGAQLEWVKPGVMGTGKHDNRLYAGPAVMVEPGTLVIVLGRSRQVFTLWLRPSLGTLADAIEGCARQAEELAGPVVTSENTNEALRVIDYLIKRYGRAPHKTGPELRQEHNQRIIGHLFAVMPKEERAHLIKGLERIIAEGVCPAMIGLFGKDGEMGISGVWPLTLPFAPYFDAVIAA